MRFARGISKDEFDTKFGGKVSEEGCGVLEIGGKRGQGGLRDY